MYNFVVAQIFGILGIIFSVLSMQMKTKKNIMIMLLGLNLASALNFLFLDSISGSLVCFFGAIETVINYCFDSKNKKIPLYIIAFYVIVNIGLGISSYHSPIDILPVICALLYCATVCVKRESNIRKLMFLNQTIWLIYDLIVKAYMFSISNILTIISIVISYFRFDYKKKEKNGKE
jgi:hypothetical protein